MEMKTIHKCAVLISTGDMDEMRMFLGEEEKGKIYADYTGNNEGKIEIDKDGYGNFPVSPGSISIWAEDGINI